MSVLINMEMPTAGCKDCIFVNRRWYGGDICQILKREVTGNVERGGFQTDCPLVPVPKHGRLIDADAFFDDLLFPSKQFEQGMRELIGDAPTVIPAEEAPAEDTNVPTGPYDLLYEEGGANTT